MPKVLMAGFILALTGCASQGDRAPNPEQAALELVLSIPEVIAWTKRVESLSGGEVHGAVMIDARPNDIRVGGSLTVGAFESHDTHFVRWATFEVDLRTRRIRVWDWDRDDYVALTDWTASQK